MNKNEDFKIVNIDFDCSKCGQATKQALKIPVRRVIQKLESSFAKNDLKEAERLLEYWQGEAIAIGDLSGELSLVNEMLGLFRKTNNPQKAEAAVDRAIELINLTNMNSSVSGATIMLNAATTCKAFGNFDKSLPLYDKASEIYHSQLKADDLRLAALYNNYATVLVDLNRFDEAKDLYQKAIELTKQNIDSLLDCAVSYVNLAHLYEKRESSDFAKIEDCLNKAEALLENESIDRNPYYAFVCEKCAPSFDYFGYFAFAKELYERSKAIYERS